MCQLLDNKVFHIQAIIRDEYTDLFTKMSPKSTCLGISSDKVKTMHCFDIGFKEMNSLMIACVIDSIISMTCIGCIQTK